MADDRFEMAYGEEEPIGILVGMDKMFQIMSNEAAIQSPCGQRAFKTKLGRMIAGPSQETNSKTGNQIIEHLILTSNYPVSQITSSFARSSRIERKESPTQSIRTPTGKETGKANLQNPQTGTSFSDAPTGSCGETDTKWVEHDEITATNFDLSLFWRIENFANLEGAEAVESEDRFDSFDEKITRWPDGRYCTPIPWSTDKWRLQKNLPLATGRVESTISRLRKNPGDLVNYHQEIQKLIESKFVEEANMDYEEPHTYLPHHPVFRIDKTTTKIRPVFDGAAKTKFGPSLNDVLETGQNLNPDLLSVLMRFRKYKIAWIADIEKVFLNIALQPEDAEAIRFLWPKDPAVAGSPLKAYKWKRVPFGLSPSPFLLRVTINKHLKSLKSRFPETIEQLEKNL
ncbi:uncharacterized protein LOC123471158 [Daphnia magna]|uniref:uncharacterized protein LOC123471158 n=1 Tax=Daphnia magna TaxID=35525 RepID=UPI001E1BAB67|nr:uncharacterized protein LOC123471158 [Daphnia magna]